MLKRTYEELALDAKLDAITRIERDTSETRYAAKATEKDVADIKVTTTAIAADLHDNAVATKANTKYNDSLKNTFTWLFRLIGGVIILAWLTTVIRQ